MVTKSRKSKKTGQKQPPVAVPLATGRSRAFRGGKFADMPGTEGGIVLKKRELVSSLTSGGTAFELLGLSAQNPGYDLSPTTGSLFPWLSNIATAFERYRFRKCAVEVVSSNPATAGGQLYLAADPDWDDAVPSTAQQMMGLRASLSGRVWDNLRLDLPIREFGGDVWRYCSPSVRGTQGEPRTSYLGYIVVAAGGTVSGNSWDLWVDYEVELTCPTSENFLPSQSALGAATITSASFETSPLSGRLYYNPTMPLTNGGLNLVNPALVGVGKSDGILPSTAIVLPNASKGYLQMDTEFSHGTTTPTALVTSYTPTSEINIYDTLGAYLGSLSGTSLTSFNAVGPKNGLANAAGNKLMSQAGAFLADIFRTWPTAKYATPMFSLAAGFPTLANFSHLLKLVL